MKTLTLTQKDREEIELFKTGFPWMNIAAPATVGNGIKRLDEDSIRETVSVARKTISTGLDSKGTHLQFAKFVPASGAASRMFKDLFNKNVSTVNSFVSNIEKFAFYDRSTYGEVKGEQLVDFTLLEPGLGYGSKPKGVLKFHKYPSEVRTALAEHLVEAQRYMKNADGRANLVVTISPEHRELFEEAINQVKAEYEKKFDVKYNIELTCQYKWTDTIAVTPDNEPFIMDDSSVLHRPAGHGALIHNLSDLKADVVSIKNIDNVAVESYLEETAKWKMVLLGTALQLRERIFALIEKLEKGEAIEQAIDLLENELCIKLPTGKKNAKDLIAYLNRPIRVCGMVKNLGEPGGGPFIINEKDGSTSLQILEGAQINPQDSHAQSCLKAATHFNPVDLVCVLTDYKGNRFKLEDYVDPQAGFISSKSFQGRELKALELPGLWNGAMSRWNTMFVEVPVETFNPVKTVMDLLRPAHQGM